MIVCPYCNKPAALISAEEFYLTTESWAKNLMLFICRPCDARVGCHKGSTRPKGTLANKELRHYRILAHAAFDPQWKGRPRKARKQAYAWLAGALKIKYADCHIAEFDIKQCKQVIKICEGKL